MASATNGNVSSKTFWAVLGLLMLATIAVLTEICSGTAGEFDSVAKHYATNDRVDGVEQRINDTRKSSTERFDKLDAKLEKMADQLTEILRETSK